MKRFPRLLARLFLIWFCAWALLPAQGALAGITYTATISVSGTVNWDNPATWGVASGYPGSTPGVTDDVVIVNFTGSGTPQLNLKGGNYTIASLTVANGSRPGNFISTVGGTNTAATLHVNQINYTSGTQLINFLQQVTVDAGSGRLDLLTVAPASGAWLEFDGPLTGSGGVKFAGANGSSYARVRNYQITGGLELATPSGYSYMDFPGSSGGHAVIDSLTIADNDPFVIATGGSTANMFTLEVAGPTTVNSDVTYARFYSYAAASQITLTGLLDFQRNGYTQLQHQGTGGGVLNINGGIQTAGPSQTLNIWSANGTINIDKNHPWSTRTGQTQIDGAGTGKINLDAPDVLGSGNILIRSGGELRINFDTAGSPPGSGLQFVPSSQVNIDAGGGGLVYTVRQTTQPTLTVPRFNAIGGYVGSDITSGSPHITLQEDAVLVDSGPDTIVNDDGTPTALTRATLGIGAPTYWKAVDGMNDSYTVGPQAASAQDPDNIYEGVAFTAARAHAIGYWSSWFGDLYALPGQRLQFAVAADVRLQPTTSDQATFNPHDAAKTVDIFGGGYLLMIGDAGKDPVGGDWNVINRIGQPNSQSYTGLNFDKANVPALPAGKTVNVWDSRVQIADPDAIAGTLTINAGATIYLDRQPTTGTYNINPGGAIWMNDQARLEGLTFGTTLNVAPGAMLILYADMNTASNANLNQVMRRTDIVLDQTGADVFSGNGIVLGNGRRLMTSYVTNATLSASTVGLSADTGASEVGLAAMPSRYLDIHCPVNLAGVDLTVGSATNLITVYGTANQQRYSLSPTGTVRLYGNTTAGDVTLESGSLSLYGAAVTAGHVTVNAGSLRIADGAGDTFSAASLTHNSTGSTVFANGASWSIAGDMTINAGLVQFSHVAQTVASKIVGGDLVINGQGLVLVSANNNSAGANPTLSNAVLGGLLADRVVINDGGEFRYYISGLALISGPYYVNQPFVVTSDAAASPVHHQLFHDIEGGGGREVHYLDLTLTGGAVLGVRSADGTGFAALKLAGDAAVTNDEPGNSGGAGNLHFFGNDNFNLLGVSSQGGPRTLSIGQTELFTTTLYGPADANTTLDLANANLTVNVPAGGRIDGSAIVRPGSTLRIASDTTIGGDLTVYSGSTPNFSGARVTVGGRLGGNGTITASELLAAGTVAPGFSPEILTVNGDFTFEDTSTFEVEIDGLTPGPGGYDQLIVGSDVTIELGAELDLLLGLNPPVGQPFTLIVNNSSNPVDGVFSQSGQPLYEGDTVFGDFGGWMRPFTISYLGNDGNDVVLTAVPEPATLGLLALGLLATAAVALRRRTAARP